MSDWQPHHARAVLVAAGDPPSPAILKAIDFSSTHLIAVDSGVKSLMAMGFRIDCVAGDMDGCQGDLPAGVPVLHLLDQHQGDLEKVIVHCVNFGVREFLILGAWGDARMDHSLANLDLVAKYAGDARLTMICNEYAVDALSAENGGAAGFSFPVRRKGKFGLLPFGGDAVVTLQGAEYELSQQTLRLGTQGVGNTATGDTVFIQVHQGRVRFVREHLSPYFREPA